MDTLPGVALQTKIYESASSIVYRGIRADGLAIVAKLLKQNYPSPQEITRYRQEYQITRSLNLEGVVKAYSQQDYQRTLVILLEDFGGESLEYWIRQRPDFSPIPLSAFLRLAVNLTDILGQIHSSGVIHRDIHPGNIVFNPDTNVVKIIDFGIATRFSRTNPAFKSPYVLEGTIAYLSPEQTGRMNRLIDYRTDFYSLGVTFYELLTGQLPFPVTGILELVHCHIAKSPLPPHELNASIPKPVSDIVMKLMAKNAEDRYQSDWGIKADLETYAAQLETGCQIDPIPLGLQDVSNLFNIPQKLYGREAEVAVLLKAFDRVTERVNVGEGCQSDADMKNSQFNTEMTLVSGSAGIGKSALVQELYKPITKKRGYFIWGKFDQFQRNIPYSAIVDALRKLVLHLLSEPEEQVQAWRSQLLNALGSNGQLIIDVIPEVELIVGKQPPLPEVGSTEAQNRFNFAFQKFIRACCSREHPLVIFLDDLQWADSATLKLIELILSDHGTQSLLLIGAYRDNEVNQAHPLVATIDKLKQEAVAINQIMLTPLKLEAVSQLISETLHTPTEQIAPIAELVWRKAKGNPYFTNEFLKTLYTQDLIVFNINQQRWQWDVKQIKEKNITDNVVELIIQKSKQLPDSTQRVLRLAACIGAEFDLATLSAICEQSATEISEQLTALIQSELILATSELDENLLIQHYKFSHDRVQQAAYTLIAEEQQQAVHLKIGYLLLQSSEPETMHHNLFRVIDHLNLGCHLVTEQQEKDKIAKLNMIAGQNAQKTSAHNAALKYFATGIELLATDSWSIQYALTLELYEEATEAAYLCGNFQQTERWAFVVLKFANTILDKVKTYETKIQTCAAQGKQKEAIKIGLEVLESLGITLPEAPEEIEIQKQLKETAEYFSTVRIENLIDLPLMQQPDKLAAMRILANLVGPTFQASPSLLLLIVLGQINLSVHYGNTSYSTFAYAAYGGIILNGVMQDFESAHQFGKLAFSLADRLDSRELRSKTLEMVGAFITYCKDHLKQALPLLKEAYEVGLETGDLEYSGYSLVFKCFYLQFAGIELAKIELEIKQFTDVLNQFKQQNNLNYLYRLLQFIYNLTEQVENPTCLAGSYHDEEQLLSTHIKANDRSHLFYIYLYKLILSCLFEDVSQAAEYASQAEHYGDGVPGTFSIPVLYFYDSIARIQLYSSASSIDREQLLLKVISNQEKMRKWVHSAPVNFQHKYELVEAEKARILGQLFEAEELYEQAIQGARDSEYLQEEAIAYELAAKHYLARGREKFAQTYMKEAHYCYERWGAIAKVKDLETRYPQFFSRPSDIASTPINTTSGTISNRSQIAFDLATAMKASQAISSEIELDRLLNSLMQILIENAGAQTGYLLLENAGAWMIEAACELNSDEQVCATRVLQAIPIANRLSESIIQYVIRTHEPVILSNATREGNFVHDPYIQQKQMQSILCFPLLNQSKLVGVLYLENQLATGAFTYDQIQVLHLLSTQAAIAIENAKLYAKLRTSESQMTQFLEAIPVGIGIIDAAGCPYYANQRGIQLMGKGIDPSVAPDQIAEVYQFYRTETEQIYPTERLPIIRALRGERSTIDDVDIRQDNATIPVEVWGSPVFDEKGKVAYAIAAFQDITERKKTENLLANYNRMLEQQVTERTLLLSKEIEERQQVENALRQSEEQRRLTMDFSYIGSWKWNVVESNTANWDDNHFRLFGLLPGEIEVSYQAWRERVHPEDIDRVEQTIVTALTTHIDYETEYRVIYPNGSIHWLVSRGRGIYNNAGQAVQMLGVILDISDRKRAEEASILEERNRMAREIHDTLAQSFTGILLQVGAAGQVLTDDIEATQAHLEMIEELARTGLAEARRSVAALRPQLLEYGSLHSAVHRLVGQMRSAANIDLIYEMQGTAYSLSAEVENNLLRIGQEALTNALKYANAEEIRIELVYADTQCSLCVKDNGRGFGLGTAPLSSGFGLLGMSERAERIGAQLRIQSKPGQGTEIIVIVNRV